MTASAMSGEATAESERGDGLVGLDLDDPELQGRREQLGALLAGGAGYPAIETEARRRGALRLQRGVTIYAPIYLSNICISGCSYCELHAERGHRIARRRLEPDEAAREAQVLAEHGLHNLLLVTGDDPTLFRQGYLRRTLEALERPGRALWLELPPQPLEIYRILAARGVRSFVHYQETYQPALYAEVHRWGPKRRYRARLTAPARAALAGAPKVGLGALLGLGDPAFELAALIAHVSRLREHFPALALSVSVPRLRAGPRGFAVPHSVSDVLLVRIVAVLSAMLPLDVDLVLSTRETPTMRDELLDFGFTLMSAGSCTAPGGYGSAPREGTAQFELHDNRSVAQVLATLRARGLEVHTAPPVTGP